MRQRAKIEVGVRITVNTSSVLETWVKLKQMLEIQSPSTVFLRYQVRTEVDSMVTVITCSFSEMQGKD